MGAPENIRLVQQAYAAFARGDIAGVIATLSPAVDWEAIIGAGGHVPTSGRRKGLDAVQGFFHDLAANVEFSTFEPREFFGNNETVVALGSYAGTAKPTGRSFASDWVMVFTVRDGAIVQFREFADIGAINAAF